MFLFFGRLPTLEEAVDLLVDEAMKRAGGKQMVAAPMVGISHQVLNRRLHQRQSRRSATGAGEGDRPGPGRL